jgi:histidinol phosphatase-like PHP family hydrolase
MRLQRQDLHIHTHYSDGRSKVYDVIERASTLNLEVMAICDHFWPSIGSRRGGLNLIQKRRQEIEDARIQFPKLRVLDGVEVDITMSGTLESVAGGLEQFDLIIGSLHYQCDSSRWSRIITRVLREHKFDILGHWDGYLSSFTADDGEAAAVALAENEVAVELNARYSSQWEKFFEIARDQGCKFTLGSDSHWVDTVGRLEHQRKSIETLKLPLLEK